LKIYKSKLKNYSKKGVILGQKKGSKKGVKKGGQKFKKNQNLKDEMVKLYGI
jgi:hypothetical protein